MLKSPGFVSLIAAVVLGAALLTHVPPPSSAQAAADAKQEKLRHVVLFKFKDGTSDDQIQEIVEAFALLPKKIDTIEDFEWGSDVSVENLADGFTHCFFVTFKDKAGRDEYLPHPAHKEFVEQLLPILDKALVVDYVAQTGS